jgi:hypothetical protein
MKYLRICDPPQAACGLIDCYCIYVPVATVTNTGLASNPYSGLNATLIEELTWQAWTLATSTSS